MSMTASVKERPIIFSGPMVNAILDGRKTMTRRVVKGVSGKGEFDPDFSGNFPKNGMDEVYFEDGHAVFEYQTGIADTDKHRVKCPYGNPGDRLYVKESWLPDAPRDGTWEDVMFYGCEYSALDMIPKRFRKPKHCLYRSSWRGSNLRWRPPVSMPRWASRFLLEVIEVRVERLQSISEENAVAEGCEGYGWHRHPAFGICTDDGELPSEEFRELWEKLNGPRGFGWDANPWVWVVTFKRLEAS